MIYVSIFNSCVDKKGSSPLAQIPIRLIVFMCFALSACSDRESAPITDAVYTASNVHMNNEVISETAEIDALLSSSRNNILDRQTTIFEINPDIIERKDSFSRNSSPTNTQATERQAFFGDLHVHTTFSYDGYAFGTLATPDDAYKFAKGEAIKHPGGYEMQLTRPMDFYAVTDHSEFLGVVRAAADTSTLFSKIPFSKPYNNLNAPENFGTDLFSQIKRLSAFGGFTSELVSNISDNRVSKDQVLKITRDTWSEIVKAADQFYMPGKFTTFAGFEYTPSSLLRGNLHRNVIFQQTNRLPIEPFSRFHSGNPEDLWTWMDNIRDKGVESIAIPHNSNGSNGQMFKLTTVAGDPFNAIYAEQRLRNEPIVEITQVKGTSETHPILSSTDEWAQFEISPYRVGTTALSAIEGSYVREALLNGIRLENRGGGNPFRFGFIGSSDTHSAASQNYEKNFVSKLGILSSTAMQRGSVPYKGLSGQFTYYANRLLSSLRPSPLGKNLFVKLDGAVYSGGPNPTFGASGLAAVWAEENSRESIFNAFRRKEVFATSGPRIRLRFFAGYNFDESMLTSVNGIENAYSHGVSMGGTLLKNKSEGESDIPKFLITASADPDNAPLQRLQVIKGWVDKNGNTKELVYDVACANNLEVNVETHRCPDNGARVDIESCAINPETGSAQLATLWTDPTFNPQERSFYYARVLENPTCRWSTWDAIRAGIQPRPDLSKTIQERAWSSPIHYVGQ